jgi:hypothetical protein
MSPNGRFRRSSDVPAFGAEVQALPDEERDGAPTALAMAIAEAATLAARYLEKEGREETEFEVSRIQIKVAPNPGPTSYKVILTPSG